MQIKEGYVLGPKLSLDQLHKFIIRQFYARLNEYYGKEMYPEVAYDAQERAVKNYLFEPFDVYKSEELTTGDIADGCLVNFKELMERVTRKHIGDAVLDKVDEAIIRGDGNDPILESWSKQFLKATYPLNNWLPIGRHYQDKIADDLFAKQYMDVANDIPEPSETEMYWMDVTDEARQVLLAKNEDYGEVWKEMLPTSLVDEILIKAKRSRNLMMKDYMGEEPAVSEGIESELRDIINYCVFAHWAWTQYKKERE